MAKLGPGARVGDQFHLIRKIGEGGCGEVFLAEQTTLGRNTVVKLMHQELSRDPSYVARFQREARLAARLIHHHTAAIYAFGETPDKVLWIAMEYIDGESLHNVLARESPRQIAELLAPVADVLDRAAGMAIIHRDVKPDNILVAPDGDGRRAVLLDFGLARPREDNDKLTAVGVAVGSPTYMSPEQIFGPSVDSATDRYALGVILYIAVAKRPPFKHEDRVQLVLMHKRNPVPPLNTFVPQIPAGHPLDAFFQKALAKQPQERHASARQMVEEFARALDAAPLPIFGELAPVQQRPFMRPTMPAPMPAPVTTPASPVMAPPPPPTSPPKRPPPPPPPTPRGGSPVVRGDAPSQGPLQLRTTFPAGSDMLRPEGLADPLRPAGPTPNPRSIEAWGARKNAAPSAPGDRGSLLSGSDVVEAPSSAPGHRRLLAYQANSSEALDVLAAQQITLGKHRDCDVVCRAFPSPEQDAITHGVSRQHARMTVSGGRLMVEDMRSLNGTFVDDRRIPHGTQVALNDGQLVRLGPVLTLEIRLFKSGAALLRRIDEYHGNFPPTLLIWKEAALGEATLGLVPSSPDGGVRWGSLRLNGESQELWWYGPQAVLWQRGSRTLSGAQAVIPGDRLTLGATVIEWESGSKPGLT